MTPLSVIPVLPQREIEVRLLIHLAIDILYSPLSVMWQPQRLLELITKCHICFKEYIEERNCTFYSTIYMIRRHAINIRAEAPDLHQNKVLQFKYF